MATKASTLRLYREILRHAGRWPSIKRESIIQEIRQEFRANRLEQDGAKAAAMIEQARIGLGSLKAQSGLGKRSGDEQYSFDAR
mmetsp:Transcript_42996/g.94182  ORF Transcript_42996/g.94182 Transcript_42996/m.94182 type:complete len:84 (-) Transcript_42996:37-288(-)